MVQDNWLGLSGTLELVFAVGVASAEEEVGGIMFELFTIATIGLLCSNSLADSNIDPVSEI